MSWAHLDDSTPKARKEHRCYLCGQKIEIGEVHVKRTGVNDDGLFTIRMHSACEKITHGWDEDEWEGHDVGEFREYLKEAKEGGKP